MAFQNYLDNMRAKPEHIRKRYALSISFGVTAVIFMFWLSSFGTTLNNGADKTAVARAVNNAGSPGRSLVASVGSLFSDVRDIVFGARKVTYTSEVLIGPGKK
jgi:hypothetical protein